MSLPEIFKKIDHLKNKSIFITGATSGLGRELALLFNKYGSQVIVHGRNEETLADLRPMTPNNDFKRVSGEFNTEKGIKAVESAIMDHQPDILILNAGYNFQKLYANEIQNDDISAMMNVNLISSIRFAIRFAALPKLKAARILVLILSTSCHFPRGQMSLYIAAKSGLMGFGKSLQQENKELNMHTILVYPGRINSNFREFKNEKYMDPKSVAISIVQLLSLPKDVIPYEFTFRPEIDTII